MPYKAKILTFTTTLLDIPDELKESLIKYIPDFYYELLNLRDENTDITYFPFALQAFLQTLKQVWFLSDKQTLRTLFKNHFRPVYKQHTRAREGEKLLDNLYDYIIRSIDEYKIEYDYIVEIVVKYVSKESGDKIMTIAEALEKKGIEKGIEKGREEGREEGIEKGREEAAQRMLSKGYSIEDISEITGLLKEAIKQLR